MRKWNLSLIVKMTGIVFIAFAIVLGNEIRLGIDRYIKNTLETDANATAKDLDKFYKSYSESTIMNTPSLTSKSFDKIYSTALSGDSSKVKCLVDKDGQILDISREQVGDPIISVTIEEYKGSSHIPLYFDLSSLPEQDIDLIEDNLVELQNDVIEASINVESIGLDYIEQYNNQKIKSVSFNGLKLFNNDKVTQETETITGIVSYYSSYNLEMTFPPISLEAYSRSLSKKTSGDNIKPVIYDYQNVTEGLEEQITSNFKSFVQNGKELSTNYANYVLLKPYEYNGKYYSTIMVRLVDATKIDALDAADEFNDPKTLENITAGYVFVAKEYDDLTMNALKQFILDNNSTYCLAFVLIIIICILLAYMIIKPIRRIESAAKHISRKEFDYPIDMTRHDELGDLARSIDIMNKELKNTIDNLHQEIERVQQMEILRKEFVSNFTHEIKTPLGIINGFSELVEIEQDETKRNEYIHIIQGETKRINELVLAMLDLSKLESQKVSLDLKPIDLLDIVDETLESMNYLFEKKGVHLITELESAPLVADEFKMEMVVNNFISNALRYTDSGKDVTIHVDDQTFYVENDGLYISEEELEKIWMTFYKVDKSRNEEGTGLGLAICKAILDLHQFEYGVRNTEKGVLFYVKY